MNRFFNKVAKEVPWHNQLATSIGHVALRTYFALYFLSENQYTSCTWLVLILTAQTVMGHPSTYVTLDSTLDSTLDEVVTSVRQWRHHDQKLPYFQL